MLIAILIVPTIISALNSKAGAEASQSETSLPVVSMGSSGNSSTTEVVSTESNDTSYEPSLAVASDGNIHIAWMDDTDFIGAGADWDIFYKWSVAGSGWSAPEVVSTESTSNSSYPSLAVDSSGNVHIAWQDWTDYNGAGADWDARARM